MLVSLPRRVYVPPDVERAVELSDQISKRGTPAYKSLVEEGHCSIDFKETWWGSQPRWWSTKPRFIFPHYVFIYTVHILFQVNKMSN